MSNEVIGSLISEGQDMIDAHDYDMRGWASQAIAALSAERDRADRAEAIVATLQSYRLIDEPPIDALERIGHLLDSATREATA